jgi:predicted amidohydrolase
MNRNGKTKTEGFIRLGAYQAATEPGDFDRNATHALDALSDAARRGVDFACLHESFLSGYGEPEVLRAGAVTRTDARFRAFVRAHDFGDRVSIVGMTLREGRKHFNAAAVLHRRRLLGIYRKSMPGSAYEGEMCTYTADYRVWKARGVSFGVIICVESAVPEPCLLLAEGGARVIFEPHYSFIPAPSVDAHRVRVRSNQIARAVENGIWLVQACSVTPQDRLINGEQGLGYGNSCIVDRVGRVRADAGLFGTTWITADAPRADLFGQREARLPHLPPAVRTQMARLYRDARGKA